MEGRKDCGIISFWENKYDENKIFWHIEDAHPDLVKNLPRLTAGDGETSSSAASKKFFIPLCGKTKDIPYLLSLGHQVFGLEAVLQPILDLGTENSLELKFDEETSIYSTEDGRLQIYYGDLFKCPIENYGPFDCIWDRGSFIALAYSQREDYIEVMKRSLRNSEQNFNPFTYLLSAIKYDKDKNFPGPPNSVDSEDLEKYFASWTLIDEVENTLIPEDSPIHKVSGRLPSGASITAYILTPKA